MRIYLGSYFQVPLYLHVSWVVFMVTVGILDPGHSLLLILGYFFVILHEYGHCLAAKRLGVRATEVTLYPICGLATIDLNSGKAREEFIIAAAGPAVNFALAFLTLVMLLIFFPYIGLAAAQGMAMVIGMNIMLGVFNLLPVFPMDGGRLLRSCLIRMTGSYYQATRLAVRFGQGSAVVLMVCGIFAHLWLWVFVFFLIIIFSEQEITNARHTQAMLNIREKIASVLERPELREAPLEELVVVLEGVEDGGVREVLKIDELLPLLRDLQDVKAPPIYKS